MKKASLLIIVSCLLFLVSFSSKQLENPFFSEFDTPFQVPPFDKIKEEHYLPAFIEGMKQHNKEIEAIANNPEPPTFENTIEALEKSGTLLRRVSNVFDVLNASMTNERMQEIAKRVAPLRSKHWDDIYLNEKLFKRIKVLHEQRDKLNLTPEQKTLLEKYYRDFVRGGANLDKEKKARLREINQELSLLTLKFGENILKENNRFELIIENKEDLEGLPQSVIDAAAETAKERGYKGKWVFTLHKPSMIPFLTYSAKRELREKIFKAYINRGNHNDELDNKKILLKIVALRLERAKLLGYKTHAHYVLEENMAKNPENVYKLLDKIWKPALERAKKEAEELQQMIYKEGKNFKLQPWDWWYYAEKLKKEKYDFDDSVLRPYFKLENVIKGVFYVANKLYGLQFVERNDIPKYHPDVRVFEVKDADGSHIGILYTDYFPRASKRGGAWMNSFRKQSKIGGKEIHPVITNNGNFSKPVGDKPSLLSIEEVLTLFHEFGHALHGLLSNCTYPTLSGTSVPRDFVELPSQIMENWALEPEVLKVYARHYKTGEVIPQELIEKLKKAKLFNQGFATVEYLAAAYLDMDWHTLTELNNIDPLKFEEESMKRIGLIPEIVVRYRSPYFRHIFSGGYSAGYYSYIWAEVLDADAFEAFKEKGIFDKETAQSFRKNILEKGGTEDPMILYKRFRGAEPKVEPLLKRRGLI
ncbi:M3 family metallopeptidase [SCandidatus Aminicenantes bacterium Aminicenantia_JdfR_composite]|jgi:peptidyl-dipeptidase Dcp|nr:M3 family metallopeptidase [SCandidatus Aminicenantes bacterium Aminicenantia_JdfR_composite]